jgi:hypothetical protein
MICLSIYYFYPKCTIYAVENIYVPRCPDAGDGVPPKENPAATRGVFRITTGTCHLVSYTSVKTPAAARPLLAVLFVFRHPLGKVIDPLALFHIVGLYIGMDEEVPKRKMVDCKPIHQPPRGV